MIYQDLGCEMRDDQKQLYMQEVYQSVNRGLYRSDCIIKFLVIQHNTSAFFSFSWGGRGDTLKQAQKDIEKQDFGLTRPEVHRFKLQTPYIFPQPDVRSKFFFH